jgi:hypothetical protein
MMPRGADREESRISVPGSKAIDCVEPGPCGNPRHVSRRRTRRRIDIETQTSLGGIVHTIEMFTAVYPQQRLITGGLRRKYDEITTEIGSGNAVEHRAESFWSLRMIDAGVVITENVVVAE